MVTVAKKPRPAPDAGDPPPPPPNGEAVPEKNPPGASSVLSSLCQNYESDDD